MKSGSKADLLSKGKVLEARARLSHEEIRMAKYKRQSSAPRKLPHQVPVDDMPPARVVRETANSNSPGSTSLRLSSQRRRFERRKRVLFGLVGMAALVPLIFSATGESIPLSLQIIVILGALGPSLAVLSACLANNERV